MNYKLFLFSLSVFFLITSCEEDDHHHDDDCHECHVLCAMDDGTTHEHEIGEFCGDDLVDIEANGYTLSSEMTIGGVTYPAGHMFSADEVCCEAHADH